MSEHSPTTSVLSTKNSNEKNNKWSAQLDQSIDDFVTKLKRREVQGSSSVAYQTAELLRTVIHKANYKHLSELLDAVRSTGKRIITGNPIELAIGNIVRRVLFIIRQEWAAICKAEKIGADKQVNVDLSLSLHRIFDVDEDKQHQSNHLNHQHNQHNQHNHALLLNQVKQPIIEEINELIEEIKTVYTNIAEQAVEHIHAQEVILTFGVSHTVTEFFMEAAKLRKFEVIVAESAPTYSGHQMALQLTKAGIETTLIADSAIFAMMPAVNKVIIGTHGVMANGGLIAHAGAHNIAAAAKAHSVPVVVVTGLYKLCPLYAFDQDTFNELLNPHDVLQHEEDVVDKVEVINPAFDYIHPDLVTLYITNFGGHNPSYIYRLLAEYYNPEDYEL